MKDNKIMHQTNILINSNDKLCLADFGLSIILAESGNATFNSYHAGSVRWMAPELIALPEEGEPTKPTMSADVYSYGCIVLQVFYFVHRDRCMSDTPKLLCGQQPYSPLADALHVVAAILSGRQPFRQLTGVDEGHRKYWLRCLSTNYKTRPKVQEIVAFIEAELQRLR
jgi:serine/threonine protein kinase